MIYDFAKSFVTFVTDGRRNNARLQVESVCTIEDDASGTTTDYCFFASCKSEDAFAKRDLFQSDNYDFCGIFSESEYAIFRTHATHTDGFREEGLWKDRFEDVRFDLVAVEAEQLNDTAEIVRASLACVPLVGTVTIASNGLTATVQFPIKTMNANDIVPVYQVDTGPIAFPDFSAEVPFHIHRLLPAYVAYNAPEKADFVVQQPIAVTDSVWVTHYANPISIPSDNAVWGIKGQCWRTYSTNRNE